MKIRPYDNLSDLEKMSLIKMSYSRLNTFDMCEAMYFYNYIQKVPQGFSPPAVLGNVIHSVLEDTVGEDLVYEDLITRYEEHLLSYDPEIQINEELRQAGAVMIGEFVDRHEGEKFDVVAKEMPFELVIGSSLVRGYIDLVLRSGNGGFLVIDYKSGKHEVSPKDIKDNLQLGIYALALYIKNPHLEEFYAELYYLRSGRRKGHTFTVADLEDVYERVLEKVQTLINKKYFHTTDQSGFAPCFFCDYAREDVCKAGYWYNEKRKRRRKK